MDKKIYKLNHFMYNDLPNYKRFWGHLIFNGQIHYVFFGQLGKIDSIVFNFKYFDDLDTGPYNYNTRFHSENIDRLAAKNMAKGYENITIEEYVEKFDSTFSEEFSNKIFEKILSGAIDLNGDSKNV